ncbi:MAG TPA: hypothetical protein GXX18_13955 [Bacillales bacterium]|nr:hypothetical protein [Bacillales bacterium]
MKNRILTIVIQTVANLFALWFIFVKKNNWFVTSLKSIGIDNEKAQVGILAALAILISSIIIILLEWLIFEIFLKPVNIEISFRNSKGDKPIKQLTVKYRDSKDIINTQESYKIHISVSGGNRITNSLISLIKGDLIVVYRPKYYDTEIVNGWISQSSMSIDNVYKDKKENIRIYWSHVVEGAYNLDEPIIISPELIIKPKNLHGEKCHIEIKIGTHYKANAIFRIIFKVVHLKLVKIKVQKLILNLKKVK